MIKKICESEEGSLLLSTFHLLLFITFLVLSLTGIVYNQHMQLNQMSQAYEAKALIEVSRTLLQERLEKEEVDEAVLSFNQGEVTISKVSGYEYRLVATLTNAYVSSQSITIPPVNELGDLEVLEDSVDSENRESQEGLEGPEEIKGIKNPEEAKGTLEEVEQTLDDFPDTSSIPAIQDPTLSDD
ncbi:MAG: hypothetical protein ABS873_01590 [Alkalibacterium sp.]